MKITEVDDMQSDAGRANEVEQCNCGVGYSGLSCEVRVRAIVQPVFLLTFGTLLPQKLKS